MNKEAKIREIQKKQKEKEEVQELKQSTIAHIEQAAKHAYRRDLGLKNTEQDMIIELCDWQEVMSDKGDTYYWNEKSNETQWEKPPGWEKYRKAREKMITARIKQKNLERRADMISAKSVSQIGKEEAARAGVPSAVKAQNMAKNLQKSGGIPNLTWNFFKNL